MDQLLDGGKIVNTHGLRGELKIQSWCDSLEVLLEQKRLYIDGTEYEILASRPHKGHALIILDGIDSLNAAEKLKNKVIQLNREDIPLDEDSYFVQDMIGLTVYDRRSKQILGTMKEMLELPAGDLMVIQNERGQILIPAVEDFLKFVDLDTKTIEVSTIEGMLYDED